MKKIITLSLIILVVVACNTSNESKAKKLIKEYLKTTMNDFSSYEPVEFSELDSTFSSFSESDEFERIFEEKRVIINEHKEELDKMAESLPLSPSKEELFKLDYEMTKFLLKDDRLNNLNEKLQDAEKAFVPWHKGYSMHHRFRGKNENGVTMLNEVIFYFDEGLTKVTDFIGYDLN